MTVNQIMIPLALILLVALIVFVKFRDRRIANASIQRMHRPNTPHDGRDDGAVARSIAEGHASGGQP